MHKQTVSSITRFGDGMNVCSLHTIDNPLCVYGKFGPFCYQWLTTKVQTNLVHFNNTYLVTIDHKIGSSNSIQKISNWK